MPAVDIEIGEDELAQRRKIRDESKVTGADETHLYLFSTLDGRVGITANWRYYMVFTPDEAREVADSLREMAKSAESC